jgi:hypothetical protein
LLFINDVLKVFFERLKGGNFLLAVFPFQMSPQVPDFVFLKEGLKNSRPEKLEEIRTKIA